MGDEGSLLISEDSRTGFIFREPQAKRRAWEDEAVLVEKTVREWTKQVRVKPLRESLPEIALEVLLSVTFLGGDSEDIVADSLRWKL